MRERSYKCGEFCFLLSELGLLSMHTEVIDSHLHRGVQKRKGVVGVPDVLEFFTDIKWDFEFSFCDVRALVVPPLSYFSAGTS